MWMKVCNAIAETSCVSFTSFTHLGKVSFKARVRDSGKRLLIFELHSQYIIHCSLQRSSGSMLTVWYGCVYVCFSITEPHLLCTNTFLCMRVFLSPPLTCHVSLRVISLRFLCAHLFAIVFLIGCDWSVHLHSGLSFVLCHFVSLSHFCACFFPEGFWLLPGYFCHGSFAFMYFGLPACLLAPLCVLCLSLDSLSACRLGLSACLDCYLW